MDIFILYMTLILLVTASITDFRSKRIPNLLTYLTMAAGLTYHSVFNGIDGLIFSSQGLGVGIALLFLPYLSGGIGAGDAKLMGAIGSLLGPKGVFYSFLFSAIVGGLYAIAVILYSSIKLNDIFNETTQTLKSVVLTRSLAVDPKIEKKNKLRLCYALPISLGTGLNIVLTKILGHHPFG